MEADMLIPVTVVYAPLPRKVHEVALHMHIGSTVGQALERSGLLNAISPPDLMLLNLSVWGRKASAAQVLRANDRVELCRPLKVDPKVARRERFVRQGAKTAGLFAKRRAGAKAGY